MSLRNRRKNSESGHSERWLVSYADFMTLLFAFFVVMYAIAMEDKTKAKELAEALKKAFAEKGFTTDGRFNKNNDTQKPDGLMDDSQCKAEKEKKVEGELKDFSSMITETMKYEMGSDPLSQKVQLTEDARGLVVRLSATDFFESGEARVREEAIPLLTQLGKILSTTSRPVRVEGHTDNRPIQSEHFPTNWELSTARSSWVVRFFLEKFQYDPAKLSAAGYGEFKPLLANDTEEGRSKNRRIEIVLLKED